MAVHRHNSNETAYNIKRALMAKYSKRALKRIKKNSEQAYIATFIAAQHNYEGTTLSQNLLKHANAPTIPTEKHPNPKYPYQRIKITTYDPQLADLVQQKQAARTTKKKLTMSEIITQISPEEICCRCPHKIKFTKILETDVPAQNDAMVWTACRHTTFAAAKRQMKAAPTPDPEVADDFVKHSINIIEKELGSQLTHFKYSVKDWYNHLNTKKQQDLQPALLYYSGHPEQLKPRDLKNIRNKHYTGILKEEIQPPDGKPRMVCSIPQSTKYIMGPVTWQMEEDFSQHLQGYCGGKNLDEMAEDINQYLAQGFTKVVEGDGSAFDNTQDVSLKEIDRYIYRRVAPQVYHVDKQEFLDITQALYKTMDIEYIDGKKKKPLIQYTILGTVFSGDCDTTLMNTTRMALYNRYVNDKAGLVFGKDYVCFAKGDDFTVMYKPYITNDFITRAYYKYFLPANPDPSKPDTRIYGLGQVLKMLEFGDASILKFCSLRAWFTDTTETQIYLTRDPSKLFNLSKFSRKAKLKSMTYVHDYLIAQAQALRANYAHLNLFEVAAQIYEGQAQYIKNKYPSAPYNVYTKSLVPLLTHSLRDPNVASPLDFDAMEQEYQERIAHRRQQIKIRENYWETMQLFEKRHVATLTQEQANYISLQLQSSFFIEYLKSMIPRPSGA